MTKIGGAVSSKNPLGPETRGWCNGKSVEQRSMLLQRQTPEAIGKTNLKFRLGIRPCRPEGGGDRHDQPDEQTDVRRREKNVGVAFHAEGFVPYHIAKTRDAENDDTVNPRSVVRLNCSKRAEWMLHEMR